MNRTPPHPELDDAALDRLLSEQLNDPAEQLIPSSGFVHSVVATIHGEEAVPPPLAFPWHRVLPGAVASLCVLIAFAVYVWTRRSTGLLPDAYFLAPASLSIASLAVCWSAFAASLAIAVAVAAYSLASRDQ